MMLKTTLRFFIPVMMGFALSLSTFSCSKKDVVQDEPLMSPSTAEGVDGEALPSDESVGTADAGKAGRSGGTDLPDVYFAFDSYALSGEARESLKRHADWLRSNPKSTIQVEGHCDERGTTEYNLALGERRSKAALDYLTRVGIARKRLTTVSYGEERPLDPGHDEAAWAKNRRAVFVVTSR